MNLHLQQAVAAHQSGKFDEAERLYQAVLAAEPDQPDALALLCVIVAIKGDTDKAINLIERA
ncbi:tetratricopeptide repeat protein, partial [Klebsiella pneumoniae]|uniref:tetratricopeptide repeat protein n=1 Tax=Klebsiella pneumoniae TaxID=573 RepID=UPI003EE2768F